MDIFTWRRLLVILMVGFIGNMVNYFRYRPPKVVRDRMGRNIQKKSKAVYWKGLLVLYVSISLAVMLMVYSDSHSIGDAIAVPILIGVICIPLFFFLSRTYNQYYYEDDTHFETVTRILNRKVYMNYVEIAKVEWSYNPGYIWIRAKNGNRVELDLSFNTKKLKSYLSRAWDNDPSVFRSGFFEPHAAPLRSRLLNRRENQIHGDFFGK